MVSLRSGRFVPKDKRRVEGQSWPVLSLMFSSPYSRLWCRGIAIFCHGPFTQRKRAGIHCAGGWTGPRTGLDRYGLMFVWGSALEAPRVNILFFIRHLQPLQV